MPDQPPKLLLLSATPPGVTGVGQLFLKGLCDEYPADRLALAAVRMGIDARDLEHVRSNFRCFEHRDSLQKTGHPLVSLASRHCRFRFRGAGTKKLSKSIAQFAIDERIDKIWAIFEAPSISRLSLEIAERTGKPLVGTVWDPPEGVGLHFQLDRLSRRVARRDFFQAIAACQRLSVISERMQQEYRPLCSSPPIVLRHGIAATSVLTPADENPREVRIGFCGSTYAQREWEALLKGLDRLQWKVGDRAIAIHFFGKHLPACSAQSPATIRYFGWQSPAQVIAELAKCQFNYLPYWFNPAYAESVRLCFPTKLTTYLTTGRPVFYHGPSDASVVDFFKEFNVAILCHSLEPNVVSEALERTVHLSPEEYSKKTAAVRQAVEQELNLDVFHQRFRQLVVDEKRGSELAGTDR